MHGCAGDPINGNQRVRLSPTAIEILINRRVCRALRLKGEARRSHQRQSKNAPTGCGDPINGNQRVCGDQRSLSAHINADQSKGLSRCTAKGVSLSNGRWRSTMHSDPRVWRSKGVLSIPLSYAIKGCVSLSISIDRDPNQSKGVH